MIISLKEAQAKLPELIDNLKLGEELLITDNNRPIAQLIGPIPIPPQRLVPGLCQGCLLYTSDAADE